MQSRYSFAARIAEAKNLKLCSQLSFHLRHILQEIFSTYNAREFLFNSQAARMAKTTSKLSIYPHTGQLANRDRQQDQFYQDALEELEEKL